MRGTGEIMRGTGNMMHGTGEMMRGTKRIYPKMSVKEPMARS